MLLDSFFEIIHIEPFTPNHYGVLVRLMPEHQVYAGHFPGNHIVPGVCSMHMITECAGKILGHPVMMLQASVVKFLGIIQPSIDTQLEMDILINDEMTLKATIKSGERIVMSCRLKLRKM